MSNITVRELQVNDLLMVANMLLSITDEAKAEISGIIVSGVMAEAKKDGEIQSPENQEERQAQTGTKIMFVVLQACLKYAQDEIKSWMASLIGETPEDFGKMPIDTPIDIISQLKKKEDLPNFFSKAFALYKEMSESAKQYMKK